MGVRLGVAVAVAVSMAGCADDACFLDAGVACSVCDSVTEPATLQLGGRTSSTGFEELQDGDPMGVVLSPRALYMVTPSVRARGVHPGMAGRQTYPEDPLIEIEVYLDGRVIGGSPSEHFGLTVTADGAQMLGIYTYFLPEEFDIDNLPASPVTLRAEITDVCGNTATDELDVLLVR